MYSFLIVQVKNKHGSWGFECLAVDPNQDN